ncbi:MAG: hypothetical protein KGS09_19595 [Nitrospirae bacterium]|nr:hypothetical protein [Nitrospirota bacterium]MBU6482732.1 hypothetical protein [Nitrospirota bacterium]MDE3043057.1 hypothetical protein [Nitrospirota bacterium]
MNKYDRLLGDAALPDGRMLNRELVREGFCWWYRKYAPGDTVLEGLGIEAERHGKACGPIRSRCRHGRGETDNEYRGRTVE